MAYYYLQASWHLPTILLQQQNLLKTLEKEKQSQAKKANRKDQVTLHQNLILQVQEVKDVLTTEINYMLAQEEAVIIIQETVSSM